MVEIIKVYRESLPALRLIGKRYTDSDRGIDGGFGKKWSEWFEKGYFKPLEELGRLFFPEDTLVPDGYMYADIPKGDVGTCWIYGQEDNGELYGQEPHNMCVSKIVEEGWQLAKDPWFFERYNCSRFTKPDDTGKVILDYCIYLKDE